MIPDRLFTRGGAAAGAIALAAGTGHPHFALGAGLLSAGVAALEYGHIAARLGNRVRLELLPEAEFQPSADDIARAARLLSGARPRGVPLVPGWAWRSGAVRVRLEAEGGGEIHYAWETDAKRASALRTAARAYSRVEVRPGDPVPSSGAWAVRELRRAGRPDDTLAGLGEATDALQVATRTLEELEPGEYGAVLVDLLPASARQQRRQRARHRAAAERMDPDSALYRVQAFTVGRAEDPGRAAEIAEQLESTFAQWSGGARWRRAHSVPQWRMHRARSGLFAPGRSASLLTSREVGAFLRPPTATNASIRVRRSLGALSRPPDVLVPYVGRPEQVPVGAVERRGRLELLAAVLRDDDPWFGYIVGAAGSGKTEMAVVQALHVALRTNQGLLFLDPHGDAVRKIEAFLYGTRAAERIVRIDLGGLGLARNPGLNLLDRTAHEWGGDEWGSDQLLARGLRDTISAAMHWTDRHVRVLSVLGRATLALAELGRQLPGDLQPTVFQLERLLLDPGFRLAIAPRLASESQRAYWGADGAFEGTPREVIASVLLLGDRLRSSPALTGLLGQPRATWGARAAMDEGHIVLVTTGDGMDAALAAALLATHVYTAARSRADLPFEQRRPFWLFLDELQTFDAAAGGVVGASMEELRKYAIRVVALNQDPGRLTDRTRAALATNRTHMAAGSTRAAAAAWLSAEFGGSVLPRAIARLPHRRFVSSVKVGGQNSEPFLVQTVRAEDVFRRVIPAGEDGPHTSLREAVEARTGALAPRGVVESLETLDGRILAALGAQEPSEDASPAPDPASLPKDPREAAQVLRFEHGLSFAKIAAIQGVSVATVRRRLNLLDARGQKPRPHVLGGLVEDEAG